MTTTSNTETLTSLSPRHDATAPRRVVFVDRLHLPANIGVFESEMGRTQPLVISLRLDVREPSDPVSDNPEDAVYYNELVDRIREILAEGHFKLVETVGERIASMCLANPMSLSVCVRVAKPEAIEEAEAVGVEITRTKHTEDLGA